MADIRCIGCEQVHSVDYPVHPADVRRHATAVMRINQRKAEKMRNETSAMRSRMEAIRERRN